MDFCTYYQIHLHCASYFLYVWNHALHEVCNVLLMIIMSCILYECVLYFNGLAMHSQEKVNIIYTCFSSYSSFICFPYYNAQSFVLMSFSSSPMTNSYIFPVLSSTTVMLIWSCVTIHGMYMTIVE